MDFKKKLILIADPDESFIVFLAIVLKRLGFDIIAAKNGKEVLALLKITNPDILLLDEEMPKMGGATTLKFIKEDAKHSKIPAILFTEHSEKNPYKDLGCIGVIKKPVNISKMNRLLQKGITFSGGKKRKFLRIPMEKRVTVSYHDMVRERFALSLSEGGIFVRQNTSPPIGTPVNILLPIEKGRELSLRGKVIYQRNGGKNGLKVSPGMGIAFQDLPGPDSLALRNYILGLISEEPGQVQGKGPSSKSQAKPYL